MHHIVVKDFTKPIKLFMMDSPVVGTAKVLHHHDLGKLKELHEKLKSLPASFGPVKTKSEAEELQALLLGVGARATIVEAEEHGNSLTNS